MDYLNDIQIAFESIHESKLDSIFSISDCICDLYCVPSHYDSSYYVRVYRKDSKYTAIYARTEINDIFGHKVYCDAFESALRASRHSAKQGKIICGYFKPSEDFIGELKSMIELFPEEDYILSEKHIIIDGIWQVIRLWKNGTPQCTVSFENMSAKSIFRKDFAETVCNMYEFIQNQLQ
ncbi:MAG: hypothetical protein NC177_08335 [Ruminococcus flavefaciens]|nr:hypothetical protein [Ruminococcus flavefaciens]